MSQILDLQLESLFWEALKTQEMGPSWRDILLNPIPQTRSSSASSVSWCELLAMHAFLAIVDQSSEAKLELCFVCVWCLS